MGRASERLLADGWTLVEGHPLDDDPADMILDSADQVRTLADGTRLRLLASLARRPASAKQLADRFGVPTTRLYHHLGLLEEHGYIEVVATRRSGARTERCYGVPPRTTVRPGPGLTQADDREELASALAALVEVAAVGLTEAIVAGRIDLDLDDDDQSSVISFTNARLSPDEQLRFSRELSDVVVRVAEASGQHVDAEERGEPTDAEPVLLLNLLVPDVLMPVERPPTERTTDRAID